MNAIHPEFEVKGIVCPKCLGPLQGTEHLPLQAQEGVTFRKYVGVCDRTGCEVSFDVVQVQIDGKWYINEYQLWKTQPWGPRVIVVPLQASVVEIQSATPPPLVMVGPGGDYQRIIEITEDGLWASVRKSLGILGNCFDALASLGRSKNSQPASAETSHEHNC